MLHVTLKKTGENNLAVMLVNRSTAVHTKWGGLVFYLKEKKYGGLVICMEFRRIRIYTQI